MSRSIRSKRTNDPAPTVTDEPLPSAVIGHNSVDVDKTLDTLKADIRNCIVNIGKHEDAIVATVQRIAFDVLRYRETQVIGGTKPVSWAALNDFSSKALANWRKDMADAFIGKAPSMKGDVSNEMRAADALYRSQRNTMNAACNFCAAIGIKGITSDAFVEQKHNGRKWHCFALPVVMLIPKDKLFLPAFELWDADKSGEMVPLVNREYWVRTAKGEARRIKASAAHVVAVWLRKPPKAAVGSETPEQKALRVAAEKAAANERQDQIPAKTINTVMKSASIDRLAKALWDALNRDKSTPLSADQFEKPTWETLLHITSKLNMLLHLKQSTDKANAEIANKAKLAAEATKRTQNAATAAAIFAAKPDDTKSAPAAA